MSGVAGITFAEFLPNGSSKMRHAGASCHTREQRETIQIKRERLTEASRRNLRQATAGFVTWHWFEASPSIHLSYQRAVRF